MKELIILVVVLVILILIEWWIYDRYTRQNGLSVEQKENAARILRIALIVTVVVVVVIYVWGTGEREYGFFSRKKIAQPAVPKVPAYGGNPMKGQDYSHKGPKVEPKTDTSKIYRKFSK